MASSHVNGTSQVIRLRRRGFWLEYASMAWMTAEAAVAITAGMIASSVALAGFGLDTVPRVSLRPRCHLATPRRRQHRETRAIRLIRVTIFASPHT